MHTVSQRDHLNKGQRKITDFLIVLFLTILLISCAAVKPSVDAPSIPAGGSIGKPSSGRLNGGIRLEPIPGLLLANRDRCWGTAETVALIRQAVIETRREFPKTPDLLIGDFSARNGGRLSPHRSHQSGRDVDVAFYKKDGRSERSFRHTTRENMDVDRVWYFIETLLLTDRVTYIFIDYELQKVLYDYVRWGYSQERLALWFQYPRGRNARSG
ncbi:MAG: penicillin-insensitive murein endopeptidase [Deltaproteobacteria bacterium]|nr:penicillin-insensitive murein endopeptidase [Deltaproteobacteria bacterium]